MSQSASLSYPLEGPRPVDVPCVFRGGPWRQAPRANGPDRGEPVPVFSCGLFGECTESRVADGVACCAVCPHHRPRDLTPAAAQSPQNSVDAMVEALRGPPRAWPEGWAYWGTTLEAHRRLAAEFEEQIPPYPVGRYRGRGIVIPGGGPFFLGVYVTVRMIRHFGCRLPIEVWHHRNEPVVPHWLEPLGVRFVDTDEHMDAAEVPPRLRGGWASKLYVLLHSSFEEVLFLDSDCYPVGDVTPLFDHNTVGSVLWPTAAFFDSVIHWFVYPTEPNGQPPITGGILLIDKARCWRALQLAQWWNDHADYVYAHGCGDQDVVRGVWQQQRQAWTRFADVPARTGRIHVDLGPGGIPLFVHRIDDKFRLRSMPIRSSARNATLYKPTVLQGEPEFDPTLPGEAEAFQAFRQFVWLLDNDPARYRPGTVDRVVWEDTAKSNAYQLPEQLPSDCRVIDVGAHVGSFTHLALRRGAAQVWAFEADPDNFARCAKHLAIWGPRVLLRQKAVWHSDGRAGYHSVQNNNAGGRVVAEGDCIETISLDRILEEASEGGAHSIHLLKLDCEGSEWPILFTTRELRRCERIVGEYHFGEWKGRQRGPEDLREILYSQGFEVRTRPYSTHQGLFWATRIGTPRRHESAGS